MKARVYIDGYNFYYAIKNNAAYGIHLGWCDFRALAASALAPAGYAIGRIKYFTAPVGKCQNEQGERDRQSVWLQALHTIPDLEVVAGFYQRGSDEPVVRSDKVVKNREEKQTDVNIAVHMVLDAVEDEGCDLFVLVTGDADQIPAVRAIAERVRNPRKVQVWFPPGILSFKLANIVSPRITCRELTAEELDRSRLPDEIPCGSGVIRCLPGWLRPVRMGRP